MADDLREKALDYHRSPTPGKLAVQPTKPLASQQDLALAYSPGVAAACEEIAENPAEAAGLTARANLVAVITNGTAVLGLGHIGPLAAKPVMEGKAVLFKKFSGIDVFDIEIDETEPDKFIDIVASLEPTFGGINLEDIKALEGFEGEEQLRDGLSIAVFHDDQHGTAIIVAAAIVNGLRVVGKTLEDVKLVTSGAGAAAIACLDLLVDMGLPVGHVTVTDIHGVVYEGRTEDMEPRKARYAQATKARTLAQVIEGADVFLGLSAPGVLTAEMVKTMAAKPLVMALANPVPEIMPEVAKEARPDAVIATGRSDYPNQVNNVLCFPYIFRGAIDVGATTINREMELACSHAIADLAMAEQSDVVARAYGEQSMAFGPEYLIPKPFDPRLITKLAPAVAKAAMDTGVATRPIEDWEAYRELLDGFVFRSGLVMKPIFELARANPQRVVFAEGEDYRVLQAVQGVVDDGLALPLLVGRPKVVDARIERLGLRIRRGKDFELTNPQDDPRYDEYWRLYHKIMERRGVTQDNARSIVRTRTTVIGALMLVRGEADAMICGTVRPYLRYLGHIRDVIGKAPGVRDLSAMNVMITPRGTVFMCDTQVTYEPDAEEIAEMALMAAETVRNFGIAPKVALLSHSNFGSNDTPSAMKMRHAREILEQRAPDLEVEGEMHSDAAMSEDIRARVFPNSRMKGAANLLVMPSLDAANIALNLVKTLGDGQNVGPVLIGTAYPAHIVTPSVTARGLVNMTALAAVDAQTRAVQKARAGN